MHRRLLQSFPKMSSDGRSEMETWWLCHPELLLCSHHPLVIRAQTGGLLPHHPPQPTRPIPFAPAIYPPPSTPSAAAAVTPPASPLAQTTQQAPKWCPWLQAHTHISNPNATVRVPFLKCYFPLFRSPDEKLSTSCPKLTEKVSAPLLSKQDLPNSIDLASNHHCYWTHRTSPAPVKPNGLEVLCSFFPWASAHAVSPTWNACTSCLISDLPLVFPNPAQMSPSQQSLICSPSQSTITALPPCIPAILWSSLYYSVCIVILSYYHSNVWCVYGLTSPPPELLRLVARTMSLNPYVPIVWYTAELNKYLLKESVKGTGVSNAFSNCLRECVLSSLLWQPFAY